MRETIWRQPADLRGLLADPTLRPVVLYPGGPGSFALGAITGEHGVGVEKREKLGLMFSEADIAFMKRLRAAFDPAGLCNPGKIFPLGAACVELGPAVRQAAL
jgi:hypothetical protein